jgi:hypothetical protein
MLRIATRFLVVVFAFAGCGYAYVAQPITPEIPRVSSLSTDTVVNVTDERKTYVVGLDWVERDGGAALAAAIKETIRSALSPRSDGPPSTCRVLVTILNHEVENKGFFWEGYTSLRTVVATTSGEEVARWDTDDRHAEWANSRDPAQRSLRGALRKLTRAMANHPGLRVCG